MDGYVPASLYGAPLTFAHRFGVFEAAQRHGWKSCARGSFSRVLYREDQVLKIFADDGYLTYLTQIVRKRNSAMPRMLSPLVRGEGLYAVVLEPLKQFTEDSELAAHLKLFAEQALLEGEAAVRAELLGPDTESIRTRLGPDGIEAFFLITDAHREHAVDLDFRTPNLMVRPSTGQLVFSDPLAPIDFLYRMLFTPEE
jgi:hypothetical protein